MIGNTEIMNRYLKSLTELEKHKRDFFEAIITLIIQEQYFLKLFNKIKR